MATYRFPQFSVDLIDPTITIVSVNYAIGQPTGRVDVVLSTTNAKLYGVIFEGFPNSDEWGDAEVMAWTERELEKHNINYVEPEGMFYRRSETVNEDGLYTIESSESPTLSDGTVLTEANKDTYDGAEGWHWYDSGQVVNLNVTPARWESIKNWFSGLF
jgi:hypothetical protein